LLRWLKGGSAKSPIHKMRVEVIEGDSRGIDFQSILSERGFREASLVIAHPPYHDIIKYGDDPRNLANVSTLEEFLSAYGKVVDNVLRILAKGGYFVHGIGDKYAEGEWVPLGFYTISETLKRGLRLKAICVKNFEETLAKRRQIHLWKYQGVKVRNLLLQTRIHQVLPKRRVTLSS